MSTNKITIMGWGVFFLLLVAWVIMALSMSHRQKKPGVEELPSNEMEVHYDYEHNVACYSYGFSFSCVYIPKEDRK